MFRAGTWADHLTLRGAPSFSPDGRLIAVGEGVGTVRLLGCETGREVVRLEVADPTWPIPVAFSPDGGRLYAIGQDAHALHLWTWDLRHLRARLKEMDADWEWPEFPFAAPVEPVTAVEVVPPKPWPGLGRAAVLSLTNSPLVVNQVRKLATVPSRGRERRNTS